jgi:uncharacterized protein YunC (DUF1805 family)
MTVQLVVADSVTALPAEARGAVLVTGSHGGLIAAHYAISAGGRAAIFNDAGRGLDDAAIAGVVALEHAGMAAAAVAHTSARIAVAADTLARGVISFANAKAAALGVSPGMPCREAVGRLAAASMPTGELPAQRESRMVLAPGAAASVPVIGLDSIGGVQPADAAGAVFHDAGIGCDEAGVSRLPVLDARGIPAATVDYRSARIGDARSMWATGTLSRVNRAAARRGLRIGMRADEAAAMLASH